MEGNTKEAFSNYLECIDKFEDFRGLLKGNEEFNIFFSDEFSLTFHFLTALLCFGGNPFEALRITELIRARALAELMSAQYCVGNQTSSNPQSHFCIEPIMEKERDCTCLYISYWCNNIFLWIMKPNKETAFQELDVNDLSIDEFGSIANLEEFLANDITLRTFHIFCQNTAKIDLGFLKTVVCRENNHVRKKSLLLSDL